MVSGVQAPSQGPDTGLSPEKCAYKPLRIKYFHDVSAGNQHPYLLKTRHGKVRSVWSSCTAPAQGISVFSLFSRLRIIERVNFCMSKSRLVSSLAGSGESFRR